MPKINLTNEEKFKLAVQLAQNMVTERDNRANLSRITTKIARCYQAINIALDDIYNVN